MLQGELREADKVRMFKLSTDPNEFCLVMTEDYIQHVKQYTRGFNICKLVLGKNNTYCDVGTLDAALTSNRSKHTSMVYNIKAFQSLHPQSFIVLYTLRMLQLFSSRIIMQVVIRLQINFCAQYCVIVVT